MLPAFPGYSQGLRAAGPTAATSARSTTRCSAPPTRQRQRRRDKDFYNPNVIADRRAAAAEARRRPDARRARPPADAGRTTRREGRRSRARATTSAATPRSTCCSRRRRSPRSTSRRRAGKAPRPLRPRPVRPERAAGAAAGRGGRDVRHVHTEAKAQRPLGHAREQLQHAEGALLLPFLDRAFRPCSTTWTTAGCSTATLVVVTGDMGRTPRVNGKARPRPLAAVRLLPVRRRRHQAGIVTTQDTDSRVELLRWFTSGVVRGHGVGMDPGGMVLYKPREAKAGKTGILPCSCSMGRGT